VPHNAAIQNIPEVKIIYDITDILARDRINREIYINAIMLIFMDYVKTTGNVNQLKYVCPSIITDDFFIYKYIKNMFRIPFSIVNKINDQKESDIKKLIVDNNPKEHVDLLSNIIQTIIPSVHTTKFKHLVLEPEKGDLKSKYVTGVKTLLEEGNEVYKYYVFAEPINTMCAENNGAIHQVVDRIMRLSKGLGRTILPYSQQIIDINGCGVNARKYFLMFNSFKKILDNYDVTIKGKISIIARINDGALPNQNMSTTERTFLPASNDSKYLFINHGGDALATFIKSKSATLQDYENYAKLDPQTIEIIEQKFKTAEEKESTKKLIEDLTIYPEDRQINGLLVKTRYDAINDKYITDGNVPLANAKYKRKNFAVIEFSDVIDSKSIESNVVLEKYMGISGKLNQGISIMIPTLGYSGTGKSYTLFGSYEAKPGQPPVITKGVLHAVIQNLDGIKSCKFRMYELYGRGVPYFFYFGKPADRIDHKILAYKLKPFDDETKFNVINVGDDPRFVIDARSINDYCSRKPGNPLRADLDFITIDLSKIQAFVDTFVKLTNNVDKVRSKKGSNYVTVCATPNNPVSSRSVLVYEFEFEMNIGGVIKKPSFVIVDLPGREELVITYGDSYNGLLTRFKEISTGGPSPITNFQKLILKALSVNPLYLCLFTPKLIIDTFNDVVGAIEFNAILNLPMENTYYCSTQIFPLPAGPLIKLLDRIGYNQVLRGGRGPFTNRTTNIGVSYDVKFKGLETLKDGTPDVPIFVINVSARSPFLQEIYSIDAKGDFLYINDIVQFENNKIKFKVPPPNFITIKVPRTAGSYDAPVMFLIQQYVTVALHIMNRLIQQNKFEILQKICKKIADVHINGESQVYINSITSTTFINPPKIHAVINYYNEKKKNYINTYKEEIYNGLSLETIMTIALPVPITEIQRANSLKDFLNQTGLFSYLALPWEGVYINENIMGLLNYFAVELVKKPTVIAEIEVQSEELEFHIQKAFIQNLCWRYYSILGGENILLKNVIDTAPAGVTIGTYENLGGNPFWGKPQNIEEILNFEYKSDRIFKKNFGSDNKVATTTLIEKMLEPYFKNKDRTYQFCVFYLMANDILKSNAQINLLMKSQKIIEGIVKNS
jgi:hypothetical protein